VWAIAADSAFSAAYVLASPASRVYVTQTGGVGSIGVFALHVD
jgi:ClpP class serine protease